MTTCETLDLESLSNLLGEIWRELSGSAATTNAGPELKDSIYAKLIAEEFTRLPINENDQRKAFKEFLASNAELAKWLTEISSTNEGRRNLIALLQIEMR